MCRNCNSGVARSPRRWLSARGLLRVLLSSIRRRVISQRSRRRKAVNQPGLILDFTSDDRYRSSRNRVGPAVRIALQTGGSQVGSVGPFPPRSEASTADRSVQAVRFGRSGSSREVSRNVGVAGLRKFGGDRSRWLRWWCRSTPPVRPIGRWRAGGRVSCPLFLFLGAGAFEAGTEAIRRTPDRREGVGDERQRDPSDRRRDSPG